MSHEKRPQCDTRPLESLNERRSKLPKKNDKLLDKFVKKNYNNELEKVLEKKYFDENTKSLLLSIMYKIETAY